MHYSDGEGCCTALLSTLGKAEGMLLSKQGSVWNCQQYAVMCHWHMSSKFAW